MKQRRPEDAGTPTTAQQAAAAPDAVVAPAGDRVATDVAVAVTDAAADARASATRPSKLVVVPELPGLTTADAIELLRELELCPALEPAEVLDGVQVGLVIEQFPAAGTEVVRGDVVDVFVGQPAADVDAARAADDESWYAAGGAPVEAEVGSPDGVGDLTAPAAMERDEPTPRARRRRKQRGTSTDHGSHTPADRRAADVAGAAASLADLAAAAPTTATDDRRNRLVMRSALGVSLALVAVLGLLLLLTSGDHREAPSTTTTPRIVYRTEAHSHRRPSRPQRARSPRHDVAHARRSPTHRRARTQPGHPRLRRPATPPPSAVLSYPRPALAPPVDGCEACAEHP